MTGGFPTTRWSLVLLARERGSEGGRDALASLCKAYWPPVHAFIGRKVGDREAARDLTQAFFLDVLERHALAAAEPARGHFRSFLLAAASNFLSHERERAATLKRGAGRLLDDVHWELVEATVAARGEGVDPAAEFDRHWALTLVRRAMGRLESELAAGGRADEATHLAPLIAGTDDAPPLKEIARTLGRSEGAVKTALYRLRRRFADLLREEVSDTVDDAGAVEAEMRHLMSSLAR